MEQIQRRLVYNTTDKYRLYKIFAYMKNDETPTKVFWMDKNNLGNGIFLNMTQTWVLVLWSGWRRKRRKRRTRRRRKGIRRKRKRRKKINLHLLFLL